MTREALARRDAERSRRARRAGPRPRSRRSKAWGSKTCPRTELSTSDTPPDLADREVARVREFVRRPGAGRRRSPSRSARRRRSGRARGTCRGVHCAGHRVLGESFADAMRTVKRRAGDVLVRRERDGLGRTALNCRRAVRETTSRYRGWFMHRDDVASRRSTAPRSHPRRAPVPHRTGRAGARRRGRTGVRSSPRLLRDPRRRPAADGLP